MATKTTRSDEEILADIEADRDEPIGTAIDGAYVRAIAAISADRDTVDAKLAEAVHQARAAGITWQVIGATLGMTRQGALKKFAVD